MKRFIVLLLLVLTLSLGACAPKENGSVDNNPSVEILPLPELKPETPPEVLPDELPDDDEEQERKKKSYIVSTTNALRVRSVANGSSTVLGYLDKNDALLYVDKVGDYYKTIFKEQTAYVHASYATVMEVDIADEKVESAIDLGSTLLGHSYVWGSQRYHWGNGKLNSNFEQGKFDCSALTLYIYYKSNDVILDVTTRTQVLNGEHVEKNDLKRGDLMFFTNESRKNNVGTERIGHVAIYFGNNYILHTATDHAVIEPISQTRWSYYITSRRVV